MPVVADISDDFLEVVDNLELVTLKRPGSSTVLIIPEALRRALSTREAQASAGKYTQDDVVWHLPAEYPTDELDPPTMQTVTPYVGDLIRPDGTGQIFTILEKHLETFASRWRCVTRDLIVANELTQTVTILRRKTTRGAGAAADYTDREEVKTGFKARIQIDNTTRQVVHGRQTAITSARMFMSEAFPIDNSFVVLESNGTEWEVVSYFGPEEIGQLPVANLERTL
jgi:hypothetical protein